MPGRHPAFLSAVSIALLLGLPACAPIADNMLTRVEAHVAQDQMMFVRPAPPTFGYQRLLTSMRNYPELAGFVNQRGLPDFLAETGDRQDRVMILYYLASRQAFACRRVSRRSGRVEFSGPYPITDREFKTLDGVRQRASMP